MISYANMKLKPVTTTHKFEWNGNEIEVLDYLPVEDKYDLIMDINDKLYKVQIKHSTEYFDEFGELVYIKFKCTWQSHNTKGYLRKQYQANEIDFFATFYNGECYLVPQSECSNEKILRIMPPKNGQRKGVSFLEDYTAKEIISKL